LELANGEPLEVGRVTDEIADLRAQVAGDLFIGFDPAAFPSSTIAILGTATLAYQHGADIGEAFNLAIREALFEQGRAIGDPDVLGEIAARFDLEVPDAASARAAVDADFVEGQRRGVTGSPHFIVGGAPFFCPTLDIERQGEHLRIDIDDAELDRFIARALQ
jgi:predicted DsbA family dithiol-disulfide isomerase